MAREIKLQKLGENLEEAKVLEVYVSAGSTVDKGQALLEVDAEKATLEVTAPEAGKVTAVKVKKGDEVTVGQTLCLLEPAKDGAEAKPDGKAAAEKKEKPSEAPRRPEEEKRPATPPKTKAAEAESATEEKKEAPELKREAAPAAKKPSGDGHAEAPAAEKLVPAGPATRRLARELGVNLRMVHGSAPGGRIVQDDVKEYVRRVASGGAGAAVATPPLPDFERWGPVERKPLEQIRRKTAEHLSVAWSQIPHVTQHDQCDITELDAFRRQQQENNGPKLTVTAFAIKAAAIALKQFPQFNSSIDMAGGELILKRYCHIGIAVDTERGLLVPVLRDVDRKSIHELAAELADISDKARQKKLSPDDMRGGTFTITNLGGIGGTAFTPIVNYPEVAILGLSRARLQPVIHNGEVVPRLILTLSLSYDHRVIDGADGARFTRRICEMLESPLRMLLDA
jgi:pyruvate dehydrogenase E2 component (dihydrolipoamide acetyltransferase)